MARKKTETETNTALPSVRLEPGQKLVQEVATRTERYVEPVEPDPPFALPPPHPADTAAAPAILPLAQMPAPPAASPPPDPDARMREILKEARASQRHSVVIRRLDNYQPGVTVSSFSLAEHGGVHLGTYPFTWPTLDDLYDWVGRKWKRPGIYHFTIRNERAIVSGGQFMQEIGEVEPDASVPPTAAPVAPAAPVAGPPATLAGPDLSLFFSQQLEMFRAMQELNAMQMTGLRQQLELMTKAAPTPAAPGPLPETKTGALYAVVRDVAASGDASLARECVGALVQHLARPDDAPLPGVTEKILDKAVDGLTALLEKAGPLIVQRLAAESAPPPTARNPARPALNALPSPPRPAAPPAAPPSAPPLDNPAPDADQEEIDGDDAMTPLAYTVSRILERMEAGLTNPEIYNSTIDDALQLVRAHLTIHPEDEAEMESLASKTALLGYLVRNGFAAYLTLPGFERWGGDFADRLKSKS
jgi:hypothetical protein